MASRALTEAEKDTIRRCLVAILDGPFIDDWEFKTRLGFDRMTLRSILSARPYLDCNSEDPTVQLAIDNCMNEVVNGVDISPTQWDRWFTVPRQEVKSTFSTWGALRGEFC